MHLSGVSLDCGRGSALSHLLSEQDRFAKARGCRDEGERARHSLGQHTSSRAQRDFSIDGIVTNPRSDSRGKGSSILQSHL